MEIRQPATRRNDHSLYNVSYSVRQYGSIELSTNRSEPESGPSNIRPVTRITNNWFAPDMCCRRRVGDVVSPTISGPTGTILGASQNTRTETSEEILVQPVPGQEQISIAVVVPNYN